MTTNNLLLTTADRFRAAQAKAWQAHPPPCVKSEVGSRRSEGKFSLPCNSCPLCHQPENCRHRWRLKTAIKEYLSDY